ncbi:sulfur carrier protein ThiS [Winslowiella iniecta]|uniref:Thiamin biosynthesis protein sulfur carrier ThiS n=1 Tax=Winslowiella iniecta TaxID=1560201 RepID=A0A0L7T515_9GAMM|nr:sulfur carrier protein ThiS [Winslowiella iniecta]KOC90494.1 thiamin biosynthesis protein sulfur carrier ThiS [Winslowiella iniecta]KOC93627.1 thiamin biosynthesis protein sulfur carrier ThiS [Winslowiella iniecta]
MKIELNGQVINTEASTLAELLHLQQIDISCVACALNGHFIPRGQYATQPIEAGCQLEVLAPMQGG